MFRTHRFTIGLVATLAALLNSAPCPAKETDFAKRHKEIKARFEKQKARAKNRPVYEPPMFKASVSDLEDEEPVIGVFLNNEARAYPLSMMFGGGGVFELLNDTCGGQPIAASW